MQDGDFGLLTDLYTHVFLNLNWTAENGQEQSTDYATAIMHFYITYKKYVFLNIGI